LEEDLEGSLQIAVPRSLYQPYQPDRCPTSDPSVLASLPIHPQNARNGTTMPSSPIPILFLKTPTTPIDPYTSFFTSPLPLSLPPTVPPQQHPTYTYAPRHIPILKHTHDLTPILTLLASPPPFPYGGLIFTSQRAVSAFSSALQLLSSPSQPASPPTNPNNPQLTPHYKTLELPLYTVGPATASALRALASTHLPNSWVEGQEAGRGDVLAALILERYNEAWQEDGAGGEKKPLLFVTGEKRRDVIPRMLMDDALAEERRIKVEEMVVYSTAEVEAFEADFAAVLRETEEARVRWVVMFSPAGGGSMLRAFGWLDPLTGRVREGVDGDTKGRTTFVASIGPTTKEYLRGEFGLEVDVSAGVPSAEGVRSALERWMGEKGLGLR